MSDLDWLLLVAWVLTVARVCVLVNSDAVLDAPREWLMTSSYTRARRDPANPKRSYLATFVICPWCVSMWAGMISSPIPIAITGVPWFCFPLFGLGVSQVVGMMSRLYPDDDSEIEIVDA